MEMPPRKYHCGSPPPAAMAAVLLPNVPRTKSGKLVELGVREGCPAGRRKNLEALANPEALALFDNLPELQS